MWGGRLDNPIINLVKSLEPDILCVQEAIHIEDGKSGMFAVTEEVQLAMGAEYIFRSPIFTFDHMNRRADFGNCIISKYPIGETKTVFTTGEYIPNFEYLHDLPDGRNLQWAVLHLPDGQKLTVFNHHGHRIHEHKNGNAETMRQCKIIAKEIEKANGSVILCGDFNLVPESKSLKTINDLLTNLTLQVGLKTTRTYLTHKTEPCDYIFVNKAINVISFQALPDIVSDHQALVMDFRLI
jgi:endonuclease/exonuclease/phosphatase family metal-dependent hydrolase